MSIRKRNWKDGKEAWQVDLLVRGKRVRKQFSTKTEAKAFELEVRSQSRAGTYLAESSKVTIRDLIPAFKAKIEERHRLGERMTRGYKQLIESNLRNYIVGGVPVVRYGKSFVFTGGIADIKLFDLTPKIIETFYKEIRDLGRSVKTVRSVAAALKSTLDYARMERLISVNPAVGVKIQTARNAKSARKVVIPSKLLIKAIIRIADEAQAVYVAFAALAGARAGEQRILRWRNIDFNACTVTIDSRADRWGDEDDQGPKSEAGTRTIPIAVELLELLRQWRAKTKHAAPDDLVFPGVKSGRVRHHTSWVRSFETIYKAAVATWPAGEPVPPKPRWHDLRHFAISSWIEALLPLKAVQEFAGHADPAFTLRVYGHLFPSEDHHGKMDLVADGLLESSRINSFDEMRSRLKNVNRDIIDVRFSADSRPAHGAGIHVNIDANFGLRSRVDRKRAVALFGRALEGLTLKGKPTVLTVRFALE